MSARSGRDGEKTTGGEPKSLEQQLREALARAKIAERRAEAYEMRAEAAERRAETAEVKAKAEQVRANEFENAAPRVLEQIERLQQTITELTEKNAALAEKNKELQGKNATLVSDNTRLEQLPKKLTDDIEDLQSSNAALRNADKHLKEEFSAVKKRNDRLEEENASLLGSIRSLETHSADDKHRYESLALDLEEEIRLAKEELNQTRAELEALGAHLDEREASLVTREKMVEQRSEENALARVAEKEQLLAQQQVLASKESALILLRDELSKRSQELDKRARVLGQEREREQAALDQEAEQIANEARALNKSINLREKQGRGKHWTGPSLQDELREPEVKDRKDRNDLEVVVDRVHLDSKKLRELYIEIERLREQVKLLEKELEGNKKAVLREYNNIVDPEELLVVTTGFYPETKEIIEKITRFDGLIKGKNEEITAELARLERLERLESEARARETAGPQSKPVVFSAGQPGQGPSTNTSPEPGAADNSPSPAPGQNVSRGQTPEPGAPAKPVPVKPPLGLPKP